ncbi:MAG: hypothetical protein ACHQET_01140 [Chitinophagales bacterium]
MPERSNSSQSPRRPWLIFPILFLLFVLLILALKSQINASRKDVTVLMAGNFIVLAATFGSFILYRKSLQNNRVHYFLRMIYGAMFFKMILCMAAALIYALLARNQISKLGILGSFVFYFIYTFVEVKTLMQMSKHRKNV